MRREQLKSLKLLGAPRAEPTRAGQRHLHNPSTLCPVTEGLLCLLQPPCSLPPRHELRESLITSSRGAFSMELCEAAHRTDLLQG